MAPAVLRSAPRDTPEGEAEDATRREAAGGAAEGREGREGREGGRETGQVFRRGGKEEREGGGGGTG